MTIPALSAGVASIVTTNFNVMKMQIMTVLPGAPSFMHMIILSIL
jgi:hypothetical protein